MAVAGHVATAMEDAAAFRPIHISGYDREAHDFYSTPDWLTAALLGQASLRGPVWKPCFGDDASR